MNSTDLIRYIENPDLLNKETLIQIKNLLKDYPYFQTAHKLYLKNLQQTNSAELQNSITISSIHIGDRGKLFHYLNSPSLNEMPEQISVIEEPKEEEIKTIESLPAIEPEKEIKEIKDPEKSRLLKHQNVRRKIKDGAEGMCDNISVTITSQIEFLKSNQKDNLEYSSEIYFIEEEKLEKNKILTIDTLPEQEISKNGKDLLQIDESIEIEKDNGSEETKKSLSEIKDRIELIETADNIQQNKKPGLKQKPNQGFDISHYADEDEILKSADENDLITKFITVNPRIEPVESYINDQKDISEHSTKEDDNLLTETLAKVYIAQGYFDKAIKSYEKLCLKYPEKNTYFAGQIEMIKELINKQQNS